MKGGHLVLLARRRRDAVGGVDGNFVRDVAARQRLDRHGHILAGQDVFDALDGQRDLLLVTQTQDAKILQILPRQLRDILDGAVSLTSQTRAVLSQSQ